MQFDVHDKAGIISLIGGESYFEEGDHSVIFSDKV